jgi:molybdopterin-containing oxidoreductase family iron-sulfur binding subunit
MKKNHSPNLDLQAIRAKLDGVGGQHYWRSLDEVAETKEFQEMLHREFPAGASEWEDGVSRRSFLKMAAASLALAGITPALSSRPRKFCPT